MTAPRKVADPNLDRDYDLRAAFPDYAAYFDDWRRRSRTARDELACLLDVQYGPSVCDRVDFFPAASQPAPLLVYIHGGYWRWLDKSDFSFLAVPFVKRGVSLAIVNYDLFPGTTMSRVVTQVRSAYAWIVDNAPRIGVPWSRMHLAGWSAGAHLSAMLLCTPGRAGRLPVASLLAISGIYDLTPIVETSANADLGLDLAEAARNSPLRLPPPDPACPVALVWGAGETAAFRNQSASLAKAWREHGMQIATLEVPNVHHYAVMNRLGEESSEVFAQAARLLRLQTSARA
jgi:arylformamidase